MKTQMEKLLQLEIIESTMADETKSESEPDPEPEPSVHSNDDDDEAEVVNDELQDLDYMLDSMSEDEMIEFESIVLETITEYIDDEILGLHDTDFETTMLEDITHVIYQTLLHSEICDDHDYDSIYELVKSMADIAYTMYDLPKRSTPMDEVEYDINIQNLEKIGAQICALQQQPQSTQRSTQWYEERYRLITASNLWKVFGSECQRNSLIYEKCKPLHINQGENTQSEINTETTLHWGVKYEPLSRMIYEWKYNTQVCDFGVIKHPRYAFIGASPDGIVVNPESDRYGCMLEIKNIVNREITGIPSKEYWIQMQIQMETCNLDNCDFVETRFKQYANEGEFYDDITRSSHEKGVLLYFINKNISFSGSPPIYMYSPIGLDVNDINAWIETTKETYKHEYVLYEKLYWYLDQFSCVHVKRNRMWFEKAVPHIKDVWNIIEQERISGYEHRAAKKRKPTNIPLEVIRSNEDMTIQSIKNIPITNSICLIKLDHD
jgi:putative phage-type endonuclease